MVNCRYLSSSARCRPGRRWPSNRRSLTWPEGRSASRTRLAHAALIGLLAKANPGGDQADMS